MTALGTGEVRLGSTVLHHTFGGEGEPPVVLIHGLGSSGYIEWRHNLPALARRHRVLAPDLPGFGRSSKPARARYGITYFARAVERYLDQLGIGPVVVVGTSMGGRVAMEVAFRNPARVARLVLVDPLGLGRPSLQPHYPLLMLPRVGEAAVHGVRHALRMAPPGLVRSVAGRFIGVEDPERTMNDEYVAQMAEMYGSSGYPRAYIRTVRSLAGVRSFVRNQLDQTERLAALDRPLLLVWGERDPLFPVEQGARAHGRLPGSRLVVIEGAGHTPQAERPDEFNRAVLEFLAS